MVGSLVAATAWVLWSRHRGVWFVEEYPGTYVNPFGFVGRLRPEWEPARWWTVATGVALVIAVPAVLRWSTRRWVPPLVAAATAELWTVMLSAPGGKASFTKALLHRSEYRTIVPGIESPARFVETFVARVEDYPIHVKGHPPAMPLLLWAMDRVGLGSVRAEVLLILACVALNAAMLTVLVGVLADRRAAVAVAPFVGIAPAAVFMTSNADVIFTTLVVGTTLAAALAWRAGSPLWRLAAAAVAGVGAGVCVFFTYGAPLMLIAAAALVIRTRSATAIAAAGVGAASVVATFAAMGFWWFDGLEATRGFYAEGVASLRPFRFFVVANIAVALMCIGPAAVAGLATLRDRRLWWVVVPGAVGLLAADLSGLSKAEVERIWLPFFALLAPAVAGLCRTPRATRVAMTAQLALGVILQSVLTTPW